MAFDELLERDHVPEAEHLGFVQGALEAMRVEDGRQIEERARHGSHGDSPYDGHLVSGKHRTVKLDPAPDATRGRGGHVDREARAR